MRYDGYHDGYLERLPATVFWAETLSMASLWVWLLAGFSTAAIRLLDEEAEDLPMGQEDCKAGPIKELMRSPALHSSLAQAHSVSCAGLFVGIQMLCLTMGLMRGGITVCEFCLIVVALAFAFPHALLALERLNPAFGQVYAGLLPRDGAEAAAAEAAAVGPQLCVLLCLADAPGHAYIWQNMVYALVPIAVIASTYYCGQHPAKGRDAALPPEVPEVFTCLALDAAAAVSILLSFPHMSQWYVWLGSIAFIGGAVAFYPFWREVMLEWIEPLFVVRSGGERWKPNQTRHSLRTAAWLCSLLCAATALGDIVLHPPQASAAAAPLWSQGNLLMLRWQPTVAAEQREQGRMLATLADALGLNADALKVKETFPEHRLMIFQGSEAVDGGEALVVKIWQAAMTNPKGKLAEIADASFPAALNVSMCTTVRQAAESSSARPDVPVTQKADARAAYVAACDWWTRYLLGDRPAA